MNWVSVLAVAPSRKSLMIWNGTTVLLVKVSFQDTLGQFFLLLTWTKLCQKLRKIIKIHTKYISLEVIFPASATAS